MQFDREETILRRKGGGWKRRRIPSPCLVHTVLKEDPLMDEGNFYVLLSISAEGARKGLHIRVLKESA